MKRTFILIAIAILACGAVFAEESVLIDFAKLVADAEPDQDNVNTQNERTVMDFAEVAGNSYTPQQKSIMKTSLAMPNWDIVLASSSRDTTNMAKSYVREAPSKQYGQVLGVRVHFPIMPINSWARISPPFEIPAFEAMEGSETTRFEEGFGVIKNVGTIKSIALNAYGLNFPHGVSVVLKDAEGEESVMFMGYLNFDGWGEMIWKNPNYVSDVRNRELRIFPLYPKATPFVKFAGLIIHRDASHEGGDFVAYFKDVKVIYDKAVMDTERDIEDEDLWSIISDREVARRNAEMEKFGEVQVLRYLEGQKKATEDKFSASEAAGATAGTVAE